MKTFLQISVLIIIVAVLFWLAKYNCDHTPTIIKQILYKEQQSVPSGRSCCTECCLIAGDGTYIVVSIGQYALAKPGEYWSSKYWEK